MARSTKTAQQTETVKSAVMESTADSPEVKVSGGSDTVRIVYCMPCGHVFRDVDNGNGGRKRVELRGFNDDLRGTNAMLRADGNGVLQTISRRDWEDILRKHGREQIFTANPPLLFELPEKAKSLKDVKDEVGATVTGLAPHEINSQKDGITAAKGSE